MSLISTAADGRQRRSESAFIKVGSSGGWKWEGEWGAKRGGQTEREQRAGGDA